MGQGIWELELGFLISDHVLVPSSLTPSLKQTLSENNSLLLKCKEFQFCSSTLVLPSPAQPNSYTEQRLRGLRLPCCRRTYSVVLIWVGVAVVAIIFLVFGSPPPPVDSGQWEIVGNNQHRTSSSEKAEGVLRGDRSKDFDFIQGSSQRELEETADVKPLFPLPLRCTRNLNIEHLCPDTHTVQYRDGI